MLSSSFWYDQIYEYERCDFGRTLSNGKVILAQISTLSWTVLLYNNINTQQAHSNF